MIPAIAIVGSSGSGKTTLIEKLISEFKKRNKKVAIVKHCQEMESVDIEGKDSWRYSQAGSDAIVATSPDYLSYTRILDTETSIAEILRMVGGTADLVILEGFKKGRIPKIEVYRANHCTELTCPTEVLIAVATDTKLDIDIPQLELNDIKGIADFIESYLQTNQTNEAVLFVNGKQIFMKEFVRDIISEAIVGMVKTLKGMDEIKNVDISIRRGGSSGTINE